MAQETQYAILIYNFGITYSVRCLLKNLKSHKKFDSRHTRINTSFADIPNSSTFNHIPHCKTLDSLIFRNATRAVGAAHEGNMSTTLLVTTAISSFLCLMNIGVRIESVSTLQKTHITTGKNSSTSKSVDVHPTHFHLSQPKIWHENI